MRKMVFWLALFAFTSLVGTASRAVEVTVSIKPIHSLVAGVMGETGDPNLLITGAASPHTYQIRPSDAVTLTNSDLVIWVGEALETFLKRPLANLGENAHILTLQDHPSIELIPAREGGIRFEELEDHHMAHRDHNEHDKHDDEHDKHDDEHDGHDDHDDHDEHGHHDHDHGEFDMHIWLSPTRAAAIVDAVAAELTEIDPDNSAIYEANAKQVHERIAKAAGELTESLFLLKDHKFIVFHDAYQYFELAFGLSNVGAIAIDPSRPVGAKRLTEIRSALTEHDIKCVFTEPQFSPDLVTTITEGIDINSTPIDPLGANVKAGENAWFEIMDNMGAAFQECLAE